MNQFEDSGVEFVRPASSLEKVTMITMDIYGTILAVFRRCGGKQ
jgi:hypothetical protein